MCIRDRFKGGQVKQIDDVSFNTAYDRYRKREINKVAFAAALKISRPASYTHLDVYKRQLLYVRVKLMGCAAELVFTSSFR